MGQGLRELRVRDDGVQGRRRDGLGRDLLVREDREAAPNLRQREGPGQDLSDYCLSFR